MSKIPTGPRHASVPNKTLRVARHTSPTANSPPQASRSADTDMQDAAPIAVRQADKRTGPQAPDAQPAAPVDRRRAVQAAITAALSDEKLLYVPEQISLQALREQAFTQDLPFLVLAHVPKYGPPTELRPCSLWCSDEETEHRSQGHADWRKQAQTYQRTTLFVTQVAAPRVIDMGNLAELQDPAHPKACVTSFLQLNEPQELQEPGRDWQLRAMASVYLASEHADTCTALSIQLADAIPTNVRTAVYTEALSSAIGDRDIKLALQCIQRGADLCRTTDAGTMPLMEATLRAPIILLRRLLKVGLRPEHIIWVQEAIDVAQNNGLRDRIALLEEHLAVLQAL